MDFEMTSQRTCFSWSTYAPSVEQEFRHAALQAPSPPWIHSLSYHHHSLFSCVVPFQKHLHIWRILAPSQEWAERKEVYLSPCFIFSVTFPRQKDWVCSLRPLDVCISPLRHCPSNICLDGESLTKLFRAMPSGPSIQLVPSEWMNKETEERKQRWKI